MTLRLISWNNAGRTGRVKKQVDFLSLRRPDIVTLQEVSPSSGQAFHALIPQILDLPHIRWSLGGEETPSSRKRNLGVMIASRFPSLLPDPNQIRSPWAEKTLSLTFMLPWGATDVHTVHIPRGASNGWVKVEVLESVYAALSSRRRHPTILTGDFNTLKAELPCGEMVSWAQRIGSKGRPNLMRSKKGGDAQRWDAAERNILEGLPQKGLRDAFRSKVGFEAKAWSWVHKRKGVETPRRFDHAFVSEEIQVADVSYLHSPRKTGLSDHSALELDLTGVL